MTTWTDAERDYLEAECKRGDLTYAEMAKHLGRSKDAVSSEVKALGLVKFRKPRFWTPERCEELARLWPTMSAADLARHFGTTAQGIQAKASLLNLTRKRFVADVILRPERRVHECCAVCSIRLEFAPGCQRDGCEHYAPPVYQPLTRFGVVGPLA